MAKLDDVFSELAGYATDPYFKPENIEEWLKQDKFVPTERTYDVAIGAQFQDLLNRAPTSQDIEYYKDYLKQFDIRDPRAMSSMIAERLTLSPEFERKGPLTPDEQKMASYYGMPIRTASGEKTGRYDVKPANIAYKYQDYFA